MPNPPIIETSDDTLRASAEALLVDSNAALRLGRALMHLDIQHQVFAHRSNFDPNQRRVPAGNPDGGQWTSMGGGADPDDPRSSESNLKPDARYAQTDPPVHPEVPPKLPKQRPPDAKARNTIVKEVVKWLVKHAELFIGEAHSWLDEFHPSIQAYFDPPKTLDELRQAVWTPRKGYDIHHIVEQTSAERDGFPLSQIQAVENLVRIPRLKHWEITGWYMTINEDYGGRSPRDFLRGKDWTERTRVGLQALARHGVLKP